MEAIPQPLPVKRRAYTAAIGTAPLLTSTPQTAFYFSMAVNVARGPSIGESLLAGAEDVAGRHHQMTSPISTHGVVEDVAVRVSVTITAPSTEDGED
jgi:hypothetical protein